MGTDLIRDLAWLLITAATLGTICRRFGLPAILGYILAGLIIGPSPHGLNLIKDRELAQALVQVGAVFLVFTLGMNFSLRRLRQLGMTVLFAAIAGSLITFALCRLFGTVIGWDFGTTLFLAGMLLASSTTVVSRVLQETGACHEKPGQMALGMTLVEDALAIAMIAILGSYVQFGTGGFDRLASTIGLLTGFGLLLALLGLLLVPRLLRLLRDDQGADVETVLVGALLFGLTFLAGRADLPLILGAFLLGAIVSETPQSVQVERAFAGVRDLFTALFFASMGLLADLSLLSTHMDLIVAITALALIGRTLASFSGLVLVGVAPASALRTGLTLTPMGEFTFIIAQMGVAGAVLDPKFLSVAAGVAIITTLSSPVLVRQSAFVAERTCRFRLPVLCTLFELHCRLLDYLSRQQRGSVLWKLLKKRVLQIGVEVILVSAILVFAEPVAGALEDIQGESPVLGVGAAVLVWSGLALVLLPMFIAIWRNTEASAMIVTNFLARSLPAMARLRPLVENGLKWLAGLTLALWFWSLTPVGRGEIWALAATLAVLAILAWVFWSKLVRWHSEVEVSLESILTEDTGGASKPVDKAQDLSHWQLSIGDCTIPDHGEIAGHTVDDTQLRARFGCSIASIDRQGFIINNPDPETRIFPRDRLLLFGRDSQIAAARAYLCASLVRHPSHESFSDIGLEILRVPENSPCIGQSLAELELPRLMGVQVAGWHRAGQRVLNPPGNLILQAGDELLVLGTPAQIRNFGLWLEKP